MKLTKRIAEMSILDIEAHILTLKKSNLILEQKLINKNASIARLLKENQDLKYQLKSQDKVNHLSKQLNTIEQKLDEVNSKVNVNLKI